LGELAPERRVVSGELWCQGSHGPTVDPRCAVVNRAA
jgi:hypothetical protein